MEAPVDKAESLTLLDIDKIQQLVAMMVANDLVEISLRDGEEEVTLRRPNPMAGAVLPASNVAVDSERPSADATPPVAGALAEADDQTDDDALVHIPAPMVGTLYTAPDPDSSPFVEVGSEVGPDTVVCILEAMKVFNEIKAEIAGTIERILIKNAEAVEYGQPLFAVIPS